jgi:hypothetical protein
MNILSPPGGVGLSALTASGSATKRRAKNGKKCVVYRGPEVSNDVYTYAIPTSDLEIVISPFALNNLVDLTGIPSGARVRDPASEEIFLRP